MRRPTCRGCLAVLCLSEGCRERAAQDTSGHGRRSGDHHQLTRTRDMSMIVHDTECGSQLKAASCAVLVAPLSVGQRADLRVVSGSQLRSESGDLLVLGGQPGQCRVSELLQLADLTVPGGQPCVEIDDLGLETVDAGESSICELESPPCQNVSQPNASPDWRSKNDRGCRHAWDR